MNANIEKTTIRKVYLRLLPLCSCRISSATLTALMLALRR